VKFLEAVRIVSALIYNPAKKIDLPFDTSMCTRDIGYREKLNNDPLEYRTVSARFAVDILAAQIKAAAASKDIKDNVLFLVSGEDLIVDPAVSRRIFDGLGSGDKTFLEFSGMYHALSIDLGKEDVFEELFNWAQNRL
jgi:acylglycerol lipase